MSNIVHIASNAGSDLAAIINAALADPNVSKVVLGVGVFVLNSPIIVPSGKTLMCSGRSDTIIRASADFTIPDAQNNAVIVSAEQSSHITLSDFTVDAAKISPDGLRLNGIFMRFSSDFLVARIDVENATGYAHYAAGDLGLIFNGGPTGTPASGRYEDCNTFNSQVHFEQFFADGITLFNVHSRDGDGDISTTTLTIHLTDSGLSTSPLMWRFSKQRFPTAAILTVLTRAFRAIWALLSLAEPVRLFMR